MVSLPEFSIIKSDNLDTFPFYLTGLNNPELYFHYDFDIVKI